jgi:hypothetical protein
MQNLIILLAAIVLGVCCFMKSSQITVFGKSVSCVSIKLIAAMIILIASIMLVTKKDSEHFATIDPTCKAGYYLNKATGGCECDSLPGSTCPANYSFNIPKTACSLTVIQEPATCPQNTNYDVKTGKCVSVVQPTCPTGWSIMNVDAGIQGQNFLCVPPTDMMSAKPLCPASFALSTDSKCCLPSPNTYGATCP